MTSPISILLVDDQDLFREGVKVIIDAQEGMGVVGTAADGVEAVRLVDELAPDVVLVSDGGGIVAAARRPVWALRACPRVLAAGRTPLGYEPAAGCSLPAAGAVLRFAK